MRSIGQLVKEARTKKKISVYNLAEITKIKKEFIVAIENENWEKLPEFPVVMGFVKNIAKSLDINLNGASAMLKRDYPPQDLSINPKPDVNRELVWSPKLTFIIGVSLVVILLVAYLLFQYFSFISPPMLSVDVPGDGQVVTDEKLLVSGKTETESTLKINNQPVLLDESGNFSAEIEIVEETREVVVVARSRSGKETVISRKIEVNLEND